MEKRKALCLKGTVKENTVYGDIIRLLSGANERELSILYRFIKNLLADKT